MVSSHDHKLIQVRIHIRIPGQVNLMRSTDADIFANGTKYLGYREVSIPPI